MKQLSLLLLLLLLTVSNRSTFTFTGTTTWAAEVECETDGTCEETSSSSSSSSTSSLLLSSQSQPQCGLYLAESSIPGAGWGIYTGRHLKAGDNLGIHEVLIPYIDETLQSSYQQKYKNYTVPEIILSEYFWASTDTGTYLDADYVQSTFLGMGALANCYPGLVNVQQSGCNDREDGPRTSPTAGASSRFHTCQFIISRTVPAGHELFDEYGDQWFRGRSKWLGNDLPLSTDFKFANKVVDQWHRFITKKTKSLLWGTNNNNNLDPTVITSLWTLIRELAILPNRTKNAFPKEEPNPIIRNIAHQLLPDVIRSLGWLEENGMCLDHLVVQAIPTKRNNQERGAFARRDLPRGSLVAPAPMVHISRRHLEYLYSDHKGDSRTVLWEGKQLLLNYCFGHPESSLLFLPIAPMVGLINHPDREEQPNVAIRWSTKYNHNFDELYHKTTEEIMKDPQYNMKAHFFMEYYALTDIKEGDEILLDYGTSWQTAWEEHVERYERLVEDEAILHAEDYITAFQYEKQCNQEMKSKKVHACLFNPPSWLQTRCFVNMDGATKGMSQHNHHKLEDTWIDWKAPKGSNYFINEKINKKTIDETHPCRVMEINGKSWRGTDLFSVHLYPTNKSDGFVQILSVPRSAIVFVDRPYTSNQYLRHAFRHEIVLPDTMIPEAWRDLKPDPDSQCSLYMAESAIPHSGLGMYTAKEILEGMRIAGGMVVQAEDMDMNRKLRHWFHKDFAFTEGDWLLHMYYWNPSVSIGDFEADDVQSIIPGLGMLANSHTGLVNSNVRAPTRTSPLQQGRDPGAGAATTFYDAHFDAGVDIEAGAELFVAYGDSWFEDRTELGEIPLSYDFDFIDEFVHKLKEMFGDDEALIADALGMLRNVTSVRPRLLNAIPKTFNDYQTALRSGSAALTVPNRVRSIEWLETNGRCLDNIQPGISTIRQAGHGAFATRRIQKGDVIAPMPVVHLRKRQMEVYSGDDYFDQNAEVWREGTQLLLNYCYSNPESSLLLFPYAPFVEYVNHNSNNFNAILRWSDLPNHHSDWLDRAPDDLELEDHAGLIMELVATRDIIPGEEIFLDYGPAWEAAWNEYLANWTPLPKADRPVSSLELNLRMEWLKTEAEKENSPYPMPNSEDIFTVCFVPDFESSNIQDEETQYIWREIDELFESDEFAHPCQILERMDYDSVLVGNVYDRSGSVAPFDPKYKVEIEFRDSTTQIVEQVPRRAIQFFDHKYRSENLMRNSFRHEIDIPESMFPDAWRDLKRSERMNAKRKTWSKPQF